MGHNHTAAVVEVSADNPAAEGVADIAEAEEFAGSRTEAAAAALRTRHCTGVEVNLRCMIFRRSA